MPELPLLAKAGVAALLAASIARGFAGAPAARPRPGAAGVLLLAAVALYAAATATLAAGRVGSSALLAIAGVEAACASAWLARADCGGGGGDGGDDDAPAGPCGPPPIDWDAFDRARRDWEREPTTTPRPPSSPS
ncbi:MAG TPA: hypothetical protein VLA98_12310 [Solirubrobacteraceae bacterium]|nr:hypothetical protein [Solirubrobacteraceae bacterium]